MNRRLPDPQTTKNICAFIRAGAFQWVAAVANGVSKGKFAEWMSGTTCEELEFQIAVNEAGAQARVVAEMDVFKKKGLAWLLRGPGREKPGEPGWTAQVAVTGPKGGALEQIVTQTSKSEEDFSKLSTEELRAYRALRDKVKIVPADTAETEESETALIDEESDA